MNCFEQTCEPLCVNWDPYPTVQQLFTIAFYRFCCFAGVNTQSNAFTGLPAHLLQFSCYPLVRFLPLGLGAQCVDTSHSLFEAVQEVFG